MNFTEEVVLVVVGVLILAGLMGVERWERLRQHRVKYVFLLSFVFIFCFWSEAILRRIILLFRQLMCS